MRLGGTKLATKQDTGKIRDNMLRQGLSDAEMDMVPLPQGKSDGQPWIDADWRTRANKKVAAGKISSDRGGFFLGEIARPFTRAKGGRRCARECTVVIVVLMLSQRWSPVDIPYRRLGKRGDTRC